MKVLPISSMLKKSTKLFNEFIRKRDSEQPCISCGKYHTLQAGHYYSAGKYPELRFNEHNVNGQCKSCNYFKSGNLLEYRKNLISKIGIEAVEKLDFIADQSKKNHWKWNVFYLTEIINKYKK